MYLWFYFFYIVFFYYKKPKFGNYTNKNTMDLNEIQKNFTLIDIEADGDCQFSAIAEFLTIESQTNFYTASILRDQCITELNENSEEYIGFFNDLVFKNYECYVKHLSFKGSWGDNLTLKALSKVLHLNIIVYVPCSVNSQGYQIEFFPLDDDNIVKKTCNLVFVNDCHYDLLLPRDFTKESELRLLLMGYDDHALFIKKAKEFNHNDTTIIKIFCLEVYKGLESIDKFSSLKDLMFKNRKNQLTLLGNLERVLNPSFNQTVRIFIKLYDLELVYEQIFLFWGDNSTSKYTSKIINQKFRESAKIFLNWLRTAEYEDDDVDNEKE
jgi:hypothetical protein